MNNTEKSYKKLPPFKGWVLENFPFIEEDFDAITNYQMMCKVIEYLKVIQNNVDYIQDEEFTPLYNAFVELKNYVDNYFENLDIQTEIDNKLDEMAESGQLADIIAQYLQVNSVLGFDTKASLKLAENLVNGSITRTLGTDTYDDGKGNYYKIRTITSSDVIDDDNILALANYPTLIAEKMPDYRMNQVESAINTLNNTTIPGINQRIDNLSNKKYLFVGDSYGDGYTPDGMVTPWEDFVKQFLEISNSNFVKVTRGGAGFSTTHNVTFDSIISELENDPDITDIIICGGYNDMYASCTETTIINGIIATKNLCNTKFPNAKIHIGFIGNSSVITDKYNIASKVPFYIKGCNSNNIHYLNNVEYALHNYYQDFSSDGIHPNENGQKEIAYAIAQALLTGSADVQRKAIPINSGLSGMVTKLNNNIVTLELQAPFNGNFRNQPVEIVCNGENFIELNSDITDGYIVGNSVHTACGYVHMIVLLANNTYKDLTAKLEIYGNKFRIYPMLITSAGNDYQTLSFKGFQLRAFTFTLPSISI